MKGNPDNFFGQDFGPPIKRAQTDKSVCVMDEHLIKMELRQMDVCDVTVSKEKFFKSSFAFPVSKDFPSTDVFNGGGGG